jgi:transcriptional regulator with XRE-family HTH domain
MEQTQLRDVLQELRDALHCTQEQMARRMGVTVRTIARWESGPVSSLPLGMLIHLRHVAIQVCREDLAGYFDVLLQKSRADDDANDLVLAAGVYGYLPANRRELELMGEFLSRIREADPEIEPVLARLDELRKQRLQLEVARLLVLHYEYTKLHQALKDLGKEHQQALEQRAAREQGLVARQPARVSGAEIEMFIPNNQADWDAWWSRLSPGLQAIYSPVYSREQFDRVRRHASLAEFLMRQKYVPPQPCSVESHAGEKPAQPPDADTVADLLAGSPHKKMGKS